MSALSTQITIALTLEHPSRLPVAGTPHFCDYKFDGMKLPQGDSGHPPVYSCNTKLPIFHCENPPIGWLSTQYSFTKAQWAKLLPPPPPRSPPGLLEVYEKGVYIILDVECSGSAPPSDLSAGPAANTARMTIVLPFIFIFLILVSQVDACLL
jgi:hypothetical protein